VNNLLKKRGCLPAAVQVYHIGSIATLLLLSFLRTILLYVLWGNRSLVQYEAIKETTNKTFSSPVNYLSADDWRTLIALIVDMQPASIDHLQHLDNLASYESDDYEDGYDIVAQEKDGYSPTNW
jgi:hypothetical protein